MSYTKQQQAKADYQKTLDAAKIAQDTADSSKPAVPDTAAPCTGDAPLGIYGMLFQNIAQSHHTAAVVNDATPVGATLGTIVVSGDERAQDVCSEDDCFHDGADYAEDFFDHEAFVPSLDVDGVPVMPTIAKNPKHRAHNPPFKAPYNAAVARTVGRKEMLSTPEALEACRKEWDRLRSKKTWSEDKANVREWHAVASEARASGATVHLGRLFVICTQKGAELPDGDKNKKFK